METPLYLIVKTDDGKIEVQSSGEMSPTIPLMSAIMNVFAECYINNLPESEQIEGEKNLLKAFLNLFGQRENYIEKVY